MADELKPGFQTTSPMTQMTYGEILDADAAAKAKLETDPRTLMGEAWENQGLAPAAVRFGQRWGEDSTFIDDPDFTIQQEELDSMTQEFSIKDKSYILESKSEEEKNARIKRLREDRSRHDFIRAHGIKGVGAEFAAALLDPVSWGIGAITMGASKVLKGGHVVRSGSAALTEGVISETLLNMSDTERDINDVIIAGGASLVLGGSIGYLTRGVDSKKAVIKAVDETDMARQADSQNAIRGNTLEEIAKARASLTTKIDDVDIEIDADMLVKGIDDKIQDLETRSRLFKKPSHKEGKKIRRKQAKYDAEIERIKGQEEKALSKFRKGQRFPKNAQEKQIQTDSLQKIRDEYAGKIEDAQVKRAALDNELTNKAAKELEAFKKMNKEEQAFAVFGKEEVLKHVKRVARQRSKAAKVGKGIDDTRIARAKEIEAKKAKVERKEALPEAEVEGVPEKVEPEEMFTGNRTAEQFLTEMVDSRATRPPSTVQWSVLPRNIRDRIQSLYTTLNHSKNYGITALNDMLFESAQGGVRPEITASVLSNMYHKQLKSAVKNRYNDGFLEWSKNQGRGTVKAVLDTGNHRRLFDEAVYKQIINPQPTVDPGIKAAADGIADGFELGLKIRKAAGEGGFEKVTPNRNYVPIIFDSRKMNSAFKKFNRTSIINTLSHGYQTGGLKVSKPVADRVAEMQYIRTMEAGQTRPDRVSRAVSQADRAKLLEDLKEAGAEQEVLDIFEEYAAGKEILDNVSNRAKRSLQINVDAEVNGLKVSDMLNTNIAMLSENYFREAAGGAAMARKGFKTYESAISVLNAAESWGGDSLKRIQEEARMLKQGIDMIYGKSLDADPTSDFLVAMRRLRETTGLLRLQMVGFAQAPESARMVSTLGLEAVMDSTKALKLWKRGGPMDEATDPMMREIHRYLGYQGEDNWLDNMYSRIDDLGEGEVGGKMARVLDNALAGGTRVNMVTSGFRTIQGGMEKIAARGISDRLTGIVDGGPMLSRELMEEVGWDADFIKRLKRHGKHYDEFDGEKIRILGLDKMEPGLREEVLVGMTRMQQRIIQKGMVGETAPWMNTWLGKTLTQFRAFSIISAEKQLVHDIRGDKIMAAQTLMFGVLASYMTYNAKVRIKAMGKKDKDEYLDNMLSDEMVAWGTFNMLPQTAIISIAGDVVATMGALPEEITQTPNSYGGFRPMGADNVAPVFGTISDTVSAGRGVFDVLYGRDVSEKSKRAARALIPMAQTTGIGQAINAGLNLIDKD
jgi:hypothetical protein